MNGEKPITWWCPGKHPAFHTPITGVISYKYSQRNCEQTNRKATPYLVLQLFQATQLDLQSFDLFPSSSSTLDSSNVSNAMPIWDLSKSKGRCSNIVLSSFSPLNFPVIVFVVGIRKLVIAPQVLTREAQTMYLYMSCNDTGKLILEQSNNIFHRLVTKYWSFKFCYFACLFG